MTRRHATALPLLAGVLALLCARRARADAPACPASLAVEADPSVRARWPDLPRHVGEAFDARDDVDRCARVALTAEADAITVTASLPDGRSATRSVSRPEDVVPTLEALLLVPERAAPPPTPTPRTEARTPTVAPLASPSRFGIELSVLSGARVGDGQFGLGLGASSLLDFSGWLVGFEGRVDRYQTLAQGPGTSALELAALVGRRLRYGTMTLDLLAGPSVVFLGTTSFSMETTGGLVQTGSTSSSAPRLLVAARLNFGALSALRTFVGVDGELGPSRLGDAPDVPEVPHLPVWTLGLALGGTVGTP